jgi:putative transposase
MKTPIIHATPEGVSLSNEIIYFTLWAYHHFALSTANVEEDLLSERGVIVSREGIRLWINRFGAQFVLHPAG